MSEEKKQPSLEEMCQFLVRTEKDLSELRRVLRNAPVTLAEGITDLELIPPHLAYFFSPSGIDAYSGEEIDNAGIEGIKLSERDFYRCIEILIDPEECISREYECAIKNGWDVGNFNGRTSIGKEQLELRPHLASSFELYSNKPDGQVIVAYNQNGKDYLISFLLFDRERFHYPFVSTIEDEGDSK